MDSQEPREDLALMRLGGLNGACFIFHSNRTNAFRAPTQGRALRRPWGCLREHVFPALQELSQLYLFIYLFLTSLLEYNCFTMVC